MLVVEEVALSLLALLVLAAQAAAVLDQQLLAQLLELPTRVEVVVVAAPIRQIQQVLQVVPV